MKQARKQLAKLLIINIFQNLKINFEESIETLKEMTEEMKNILKEN